jgi:hypothetical protein
MRVGNNEGERLLIPGSHYRIREFMYKLMRGQDVTVSAIGGSSM